MKQQGISSRISKVNQQLEKLANLIQNDRNVYNKTKEALQQLQDQESSEESFSYFQMNHNLNKSKGMNIARIQLISNLSQQLQSNVYSSTTKSGLAVDNAMKISKIMKEEEVPDRPVELIGQSRTADITVKKFRPVYSPNRKNKKQSQQKIQEKSKNLKNSKSENKVSLSTKTQSIKKSSKKMDKDSKKLFQPFNFATQLKGVYKKTKTAQNLKTSSQNRTNQSLKMHINLKKQVNMKITDLNIQKQQCQKQAQYLKSVMKVEQQQKIQCIIQHIKNSSQQSALMVFMARLLVNFFSQFFHQKLVFSEQCTCQQLQFIISKKNYLIKYMMKLPDILKKDNTLCEQRCKKLFEQKHFLDHKIQIQHKHLHLDTLYMCIDSLQSYTSFLLNNNMVKQTKRKVLPYQFHSQRSARNNTSNAQKNYGTNTIPHIGVNQSELSTIHAINNDGKPRQYDSDRKPKAQTNLVKGYSTNTNTLGHHKSVNMKPGLKRTNTMKVLSPKHKVKIGHKQR